jgi:membrane-associated PAP2 superfamily phosphatase
MSTRSPAFPLIITLAALLALVAWDASGLDLALAAPFAGPFGFPLKDDWILTRIFHRGARMAAWIPALWLVAGIFLPTGIQRQLSRRERVLWAVSTLAALAAISLAKHVSLTSCPWDLAQFGGSAQWVSHWAWGISDGGPGRCFPAGHASAGFAFVTAWFVLRDRFPRAALAWLLVSLAAGLLLGGVQQVRGAHYMSHTLWTAWTCWTVGYVISLVARPWRTPQPALTAGRAAT